MADWFKLHENWFQEPRLQWAIGQQNTVTIIWLWVLTECCRTRCDTIGLHAEDHEMLGIQQLLGIAPGIFRQGVALLTKIKYIEVNDKENTIKVLKWKDFQNEYLHRKSRGDYDNIRESPQISANLRKPPTEERRGEEIRGEKKEASTAFKFQRPTVAQVAEYMATLELPEGEAQAFVDKHDTTGWVSNGSAIKDWKAAARTWKRNFLKWGSKSQKVRRDAPI